MRSIPYGLNFRAALLSLAVAALGACGTKPSDPNAHEGRSPDAEADAGGEPTEPVRLTVFDAVVFYDGYASLTDAPVPDGVQRLRNDLFTRRLSNEELDSVQNTLRMQVVIGALCDNYDRIGSVALALVPKGSTSYTPDDVTRIELGRFITPFMNKNRQPDEVEYHYDISNVVPVLHDAALRSQFDLWVELEVFGVPYAANKEVAGCADRSDVFAGTLVLESDRGAEPLVFDDFVPLAYKVPFNNYQDGASDEIGATRKTIPFTLAADTTDARVVLITSNHGANSGGEEYARRDHFVYVDGATVHTYKPGRATCEPFRRVNTQPNGIYGSSRRSDAQWQSFSNWCPGDVIDTRIIELGALPAGVHEFAIDVPDAKFAGGEGNFPLSLYVQARR
jgi:Peptide-N-glycosidase F, C terminal/Peptide-N-glycosidase F, N terminal